MLNAPTIKHKETGKAHCTSGCGRVLIVARDHQSGKMQRKECGVCKKLGKVASRAEFLRTNKMKRMVVIE